MSGERARVLSTTAAGRDWMAARVPHQGAQGVTQIVSLLGAICVATRARWHAMVQSSTTLRSIKSSLSVESDLIA